MHYNLARACGADGLQPCATQQSSRFIHGGGAAANAVDGNVMIDGNIGHGDHCTHTDDSGSSLSPWWMVDLGQVRAVRAIKIWNRGDCCSDRLQGFDIRIGTSASSYSTATACFTGGTAPLTSPFTVQVDCEGSGRYLYIGLPGRSAYLTLCEVEVYQGATSFRRTCLCTIPTYTYTYSYGKLAKMYVRVHIYICIYIYMGMYIYIMDLLCGLTTALTLENFTLHIVYYICI